MYTCFITIVNNCLIAVKYFKLIHVDVSIILYYYVYAYG